VFPVLAATGCGSVPWRYDFEDGLRTAAEQRRRAVVLFTAADNADSREMDFRTFSDAKVQAMMREFVPVRLDYYFNRSRADRLGIDKVPSLVVIRPDGSVAGTHSGKLSPEDLRLFLAKNRFN
jgi:hypothetical protein